MTSSTVSSESAPKSSTNDASGVTSSSSTPSCSTMMLFTLSATAIPPSSHVHPAVHGQNVPCNIRCLVGCKEAHRRRHIVYGPETTERNLLGPAGLRFFRDRLCHICLNQPRRDHIDRDPARGHLARQRLRKSHETGLRRRIVGLPGVARLPDH